MPSKLNAKSGGVSKMYRWDFQNDRKIIKNDIDRQRDYIVPPKNLKCVFVVNGISEEFRMNTQYGESTWVRIELKILKVADKKFKAYEGKLYDWMIPYEFGPKQRLRHFLGVLRQRKITDTETDFAPLEWIGSQFVALTELKPSNDGTKHFPGIVLDSIEDDSVKPSPLIGSGKFDDVYEEESEQAPNGSEPGFADDTSDDEDDDESGSDDDPFGIDEGEEFN